MPGKNPDLHGSAPDKADVALLLVDVINDFDFPEGEQLLHYALPMAKRIAALKQRAATAQVPAIYANDNFGRWRSNFQSQVEHCLRPAAVGRKVVELLEPSPDDYFVLKPKHSGFYSTALELLLRYLDVKKVIITGVAGNNCVLFTASDAYLRDLEVHVPTDCTASNTKEENDSALTYMQKILHADISESTKIRFPQRQGGSSIAD